MTDSEIIKFSKHSVIKHCDNCPYEQYHYEPQLEDETLDLINRQKAEIERLNRKLTDAYLIIDRLRGDSF